jgi:hypothetical protein
MTLTFHRTDERLLIKYIDDTFNIFTCVIPYHDKFVIDYCNSKLEKLEKLLKNYILEEHDNKIILKVEEPICINYTLNKQSNTAGEQSGLILSKLKQLEKENKILKEKLEDTELVYLDRYMIPISKGITTLYFTSSFYILVPENTILDLSPLEVCKKLTKININLSSYIQIIDLTPLKNLVELTIVNNSAVIKSVLGLEYCKKLNYLKFTNCTDSNVQKTIFENCTSLKELYITHCPDAMDFSKLQYTLERLTIENCKYFSNIENCKLLQYLKIIHIENYQYTCKLDNLSKLKEIILQGNIIITGLQNCINLKKISFSNYSSLNINLQDKNMADFKFLETIDLTGSSTEFKNGISNIRSGVQKIGF